jgi:hypothetical protein
MHLITMILNYVYTDYVSTKQLPTILLRLPFEIINFNWSFCFHFLTNMLKCYSKYSNRHWRNAHSAYPDECKLIKQAQSWSKGLSGINRHGTFFSKIYLIINMKFGIISFAGKLCQWKFLIVRKKPIVFLFSMTEKNKFP